MSDHLEELKQNIQKWRSQNIDEYWVHVGYIGAAVHRFGDHVLTIADGKLYHQWQDDWREIETGSDFWLFSVPGAFAWARDMITKVMPADEKVSEDTLQITYNETYGYIELLRVSVGERATTNFTFETKAFGVGRHPDL